MMGAVKLFLGSSLLVSSYIVGGMLPTLHVEHSQLAHMQVYSRPNVFDTSATVAEDSVKIDMLSARVEQNWKDIRALNTGLTDLDKRELEHYNALARQQEVDETKVISVLKFVGWLVSLAEGAHVTLIVKGAVSRRRKARTKRRHAELE